MCELLEIVWSMEPHSPRTKFSLPLSCTSGSTHEPTARRFASKLSACPLITCMRRVRVIRNVWTVETISPEFKFALALFCMCFMIHKPSSTNSAAKLSVRPPNMLMRRVRAFRIVLVLGTQFPGTICFLTLSLSKFASSLSGGSRSTALQFSGPKTWSWLRDR